jgi:hypothetical protein
MEFRITSLDRERRRSSLSRKSGNAAVKNKAPEAPAPKKPSAVGNSAFQTRRQAAPKPRKDDDGSMYNPFAEAFKKIREK